MRPIQPIIRTSIGITFLLTGILHAQESSEVTVEVDWFAEILKGGLTSVALIALLMAGITFAVERTLASRSRFISPDGLATKVAPLWSKQDYDGILSTCRSQPSTLSRMIEFLVGHRDTSPDLLIPGAQDIATRELKRQAQKNYSLAVVAALAPLLGLLGTMIGMIESFKLVEVYGDDGGASMLAGSISKALITTAVGLIIAIGNLVIYHWIKSRTNASAIQLDEDFERLVNAWLLTPVEKTNEPSHE
ncbi:MotA/TolQ/ExbB proton channel family protein [Haloferula sp.]|uniref:MotA/TolQ/ExbB proton channel family protein n=1 Tax=Haloferula sp. TaxID=2497595 RepID=UPI003C7913C0